MNRPYAHIAVGLALAAIVPAASAQVPAVPVSADNFVRAESDMYFGNLAKEAGRLGVFFHHREPASIDHQTVIRLNRDTLYSSAVFDLDAGPVKIVLPDAGTRFMSLMTVSQDHYASTAYGVGPHVIDKEKVGTRYVVAGVRTLVDPDDPKDLAQVHTLQDAIKASQGSTGKLELPSWDAASQKKVRDALLVLGSTLTDFKAAFGEKDQVDPVRHLIVTAAAWGGNPDRDAIYLSTTPARNDGTTIYNLNVKDVPVEAFWSVSVYNADGYYEKNALNAYSINSITGKKGSDGSIPIQFGGCDGTIPNCIPTAKGWKPSAFIARAQRF